MAPKKQANNSNSQQKTDLSRSNSTSMEASQDWQMKLEEMMKQHNRRCKERRRQRKEAVVAAHDVRIEKLHGDIKQCLQSHKQKVTLIRRPKLERLVQLVQKKRALQDRIDNCRSELEQAFLSTARQLQVALDGRVEDLTG